jgi:hypothetical protein
MRDSVDKKGQMRIIEALLASFVILFAITFVNIFAVTPSSSTYETGELEKVGYNVLHDLDEQNLLSRFVFNQEWTNLTAALMVSLPPDVYFNLTVYDLEGDVINTVPIRYGSSQVFSESAHVASVTYILPGYQTSYNPRILILQLVRG